MKIILKFIIYFQTLQLQIHERLNDDNSVLSGNGAPLWPAETLPETPAPPGGAAAPRETSLAQLRVPARFVAHAQQSASSQPLSNDVIEFPPIELKKNSGKFILWTQKFEYKPYFINLRNITV